MRKVLVSLTVCSLSMCGSCLGFNADPWRMNYFPKSSSFVEVSNQVGELRKVKLGAGVDVIDSNKVEVVKASENFVEDLKKVDEKRIAEKDLARKWGTKDGKIYCIGDRNVFLSWSSEGSNGKTRSESSRFFSYFGEPREGLVQQIKETDRSLKQITNDFSNMMSDFEHFFDPFFFNPSLTSDSSLWGNATRSEIKESENALHLLENESQESKLSNSDSRTNAVEISSPKKKILSWLKDISLFAAGGLVVGGLVTLKTNPDFYKNMVKDTKGLISTEKISTFYSKVVKNVKSWASAKKISSFYGNVKTTMSEFISNHFAS